MTTPADSVASSNNPYQPPTTPPVLSVPGRRFVCPQCDTTLPFFRIWFFQPIGRCANCRTRLVVRRPGWSKLWTPLLVIFCFVSCFLVATKIGFQAIYLSPCFLIPLAVFDGITAFKIGYFDRPRGIL